MTLYSDTVTYFAFEPPGLTAYFHGMMLSLHNAVFLTLSAFADFAFLFCLRQAIPHVVV